MALGLATELASVVGEDRSDLDAQGLIERKHPLVEQITRRDRHLRRVDLREGKRAEDVDHDLDVDLAHALQRPPVERVLVQQLPRSGSLDVATAEVGAVALEQLDLPFAEQVGVVLDVLLEA